MPHQHLYLYGVSIRLLLHEKMATSIVIPFSFLMPCNLTLIEGPKSGGSADTPLLDSGIPTQIWPGSQCVEIEFCLKSRKERDNCIEKDHEK